MIRNLLAAALIFISQIAFSQVDDCKCFEGIDSNESKKPGLTIEFRNGIKLSVCGYEDERISESEIITTTFNIFNCVTGELLIQSGHPEFEICNIQTKPDTLILITMTPLPTGENWDYQLTPVTQQLIYPQNDSIIVKTPVCIYQKTKIEQASVDQFFIEMEAFKGNGYNKEMEILIGKLGVLTLNGNSKARNILNDFVSYMGGGVDGFNSEILNAVTSITNFECQYNE